MAQLTSTVISARLKRVQGHNPPRPPLQALALRPELVAHDPLSHQSHLVRGYQRSEPEHLQRRVGVREADDVSQPATRRSALLVPNHGQGPRISNL